jgi:hypothetical protein
MLLAGCSARHLDINSSPQKNEITDFLPGKENTTQIETTLNWAFTVSILASGIGVVLLFVKPTLGITVLGSGLTGSLLAASAIRYMDALLLLGGIALLSVIVFFVIYLYRNRKALTENIKLIEQMKPALPDAVKYKVFGEKGLADQVQSKETKKIVQNVRKKKLDGISHTEIF